MKITWLLSNILIVQTTDKLHLRILAFVVRLLSAGQARPDISVGENNIFQASIKMINASRWSKWHEKAPVAIIVGGSKLNLNKLLFSTRNMS